MIKVFMNDNNDFNLILGDDSKERAFVHKFQAGLDPNASIRLNVNGKDVLIKVADVNNVQYFENPQPIAPSLRDVGQIYERERQERENERELERKKFEKVKKGISNKPAQQVMVPDTLNSGTNIDKAIVMQTSQIFVSRGQYDEAIAEWNKLIMQYPNDASLYNTVGDLYLKKNAKQEAVNAYQRAADILSGEGYIVKAAALYKKTLNLDPSKTEIYVALGDLDVEKGMVNNALGNYKTAAEQYAKRNDTAKKVYVQKKILALNTKGA